jgi:hypothetical protein
MHNFHGKLASCQYVSKVSRSCSVHSSLTRMRRICAARGLQRHRITFIREMDEDELRKAGDGEPTIDGIEIVEFESHEEAMEYLKKTAPAFAW